MSIVGIVIIMRMRNIRNSAVEMKGHPVTAHRQLLLRLIHDARGHIDAKELYRRATRKDESISLATVYRSLRFFKELGLVDERRLGQVGCYYEIKQTPEHQHLLCRGCGKIIEFENSLVHKLVEVVRREHLFNVTKVDLYLEGYCAKCDGEKKSILRLAAHEGRTDSERG
jgi:Fur family transcriptional regulator, ferric uptake regulator